MLKMLSEMCEWLCPDLDPEDTAVGRRGEVLPIRVGWRYTSSVPSQVAVVEQGDRIPGWRGRAVLAVP